MPRLNLSLDNALAATRTGEVGSEPLFELLGCGSVQPLTPQGGEHGGGGNN